MGDQAEKRKHILVALVENKPGVLNRVASLFRRRNFNVDSLTVGRTQRSFMSRMTIVVDGSRIDGRRIAANLFKLINVIDVAVVSEEPHVSRDLALIKVRANDAESRNHLTQICDQYPAYIVDIGPEVAIVQIAAQEDLVEMLIKELEPLGIVEMVRTGVVAMGRGVRILDSQYEPVIPATKNGNGNAAYQVYGV
ncbi:MAG: acetolactate synthase small subunit [Chloroflexi bacterium OLB15]|nr:MAG: acetolactate synthase small subunit [Chloroflexi bacterium OLB15]